MKKIRKIAVGLAVCIALTAVPAYASDSVITLLPFPVEATIGENTRVLTLDEAFVLARRNNTSIEAITDSITLLEQQRRHFSAAYDSAWRWGMGMADHLAETSGRTVRSIDLAINNIPMNTAMLETVSDFLVINSLSTLDILEMNLAMLREAKAVDEVTLRHTELRNNLGLASNAEVTSARQNVEQGRALMRTMNIGIENQRAALNNLLGLPSDADVVIEHNFSIEAGNISAQVRDIRQYTDRQIARDPSLSMLRRQLEAAEHNYNVTQPWLQNIWQPAGATFNIENNATDRATVLNSVNTASRELRDATDNMRENIRNTYEQLRQLEAQRESLLISLQSAHDTYETMKVNFAAGMATQHQVDSVRLAVLAAESEIIVNAHNYQLLLFAFESPFLLN